MTVRIDGYRPEDRSDLIAFVAAIQEHERSVAADLKPGAEIGVPNAELLLQEVAAHDGVILFARDRAGAVGFASAWLDRDDDPLLRDELREHAYLSDIYVIERRRREGIARRLLDAVETEMRGRGCRRIRICSKATNLAALGCYQAAGYRPYEVILSKPLA